MKQSKPIRSCGVGRQPCQNPLCAFRLGLPLVVAVLCLSSHATTLTVGTMTELTETLERVAPGDRILLRDGIYEQALHIDCEGTLRRPIRIESMVPGAAVFRNSIRLRGAHMVVSGLRFEDGGQVLIEAPHVRVTRCMFVDCAPKTWLRIDPPQHDVEIDHCLFADKTNNRMYDLHPAGNRGSRPAVVIMTGDSPRATPDHHHIHHNHFRDMRSGTVPDGYEAVVLTTGNSRTPRGSARILLEYNLFERCAGETEIISVRCNDNIIRHNAFIDCRGSLSFTRGHGNIACGNYFDGMHNGGACGVRVHDAAVQQITNNHFRRLRWGIVFSAKDAGRDGRPSAHRCACHNRPANVLILSNTFEHCSHAMYAVAPCISGAARTATTGIVWTVANNTFHHTAARHTTATDIAHRRVVHWIGNRSAAGGCAAAYAASAFSIPPGGDPRTDRIVGSCDLLHDDRLAAWPASAELAFTASSLPIVMPLCEEDVGPFGFLVASPPVIECQPRSRTVQDGDDVTFHVAATGWPLFFQWYRNGVKLEDEIEPTLTVERVSSDDDGTRFHVLVENENGTLSSDTATLNVVPFTNVHVVESDGSSRPDAPAASGSEDNAGDTHHAPDGLRHLSTPPETNEADGPRDGAGLGSPRLKRPVPGASRPLPQSRGETDGPIAG